jgi:hypothetical protein
MTDRSHCGGCDRPCMMGLVCLMGACTDAPPTRYMQTTPTAAEVPFLDACAAPGRMLVLPDEDDSNVMTPLPFAFRYWATDLAMGAMINVTTNGWIGMDGMDDASLGGVLGDADTPNAVIAPHWNDGYTRSGICIATMGTAPNRQLVIEWTDATYCCPFPGFPDPTHNTYEIILTESNNTIDFVFQTMTGTETGTMGLEDQTGAMSLNACPGGVDECIPTTGQRVRFLPIP